MVNPVILVILTFLIFFTLLVAGVKIGVSLLLSGTLGFFFYQGNEGLIGMVPFVTLNSFILSALPLFIFMGSVLGECGASEMIYRGVTKWLSPFPGGLLHSNIGTCAMFAAVSGSSPATAATVGSVAIPRMKELGYDEKLTLGSIAAGGTLGILIPPSLTMIVFGFLTGTSVGALFAGGVVPGIMLSIMFMIYIGVWVAKNPKLAPKEPVVSLKEMALSLISMWPLFVMGVVVLGGIFVGFVTPTEAAAVGCATALVIGLVLRRLSWQILWKCVKESAQIGCMVLFMVMGAFVFASFLSQTGVPGMLSDFVLGLGLPELSVLAVIYLLYIFLGCFVDPGSMMIITLPSLLPILASFGIDLVWFGVVVVMLSEIGMITPPFGLNLFIIQGISGKEIDVIVVGTIPFLLILLLAVVILTVFPSIVVWFPSVLFGG